MGVLGASFNVHKVEAQLGTIYIKADGSIDPPTANITSLDNVTYTFTADNNASIVVEKNNIIIDGAGYTVQGTGSGTGIDLSDRSNVTLKNVEVTNFTYGIFLNSSSNNHVTGNTASNNWAGIYLSYSSNNNVLTGNTASNNDIHGIYLKSSSNNHVTGNTASGGYYGIYLYDSSNNTVSGNNASNNDIYGINLYSSTNNTVSGNTASSNGDEGIYLDSSSNNAITGNNASNNQDGIFVGYLSNNNTVSGNTASSNGYQGIYLYDSTNNTVSGNTASSNGDEGIYLDYSSNNTVTGNTVSNNQYGIYLQESNNNAIFHNNFMNNTQQVYNYSPSYANFWDDGYPSGGNYWSNYTGVDLDHDGIGDTEHVIDANNKDNYPLMGMFSDFKATSEHHVQTICNSSISDFQYNGTVICFNVTGETDTTGFCRICIPKALMNETYKVFVNGTEVQCNLLPCSNTTHSYLYFTYNHSTQEVIIIPEFPSFLILPLFMATTLLAVIVILRKHRANPRVPV